MALRIVLVRHGLSTYNLDGRIQGRDDLSDLTDVGHDQARRAGEALADLELARAYSSPLSRARQTTSSLLSAHGSPTAVDHDEDRLEVDLEPWSGILRGDLTGIDPEGERRWRQAPETLELERADGTRFRPLVELMAQAGRFADRIVASHDDALSQGTDGQPGIDESILVVAHNAILRCLVLHLLGLPLSGFPRLRIENGSVSVLNLSRDGDGALKAQIESLNGLMHLGTPMPRRVQGPRLLLVRHGETDWNRQGRFQGQMDIPLNARGLQQADAARQLLSEVAIQRAFTSSMPRSRQTAEAILADHPGVDLSGTDGLREIGHGLWEGRLEEEIAEGWPELLAEWKRAPETVLMPEGESVQMVWDRSLKAWAEIVASLTNQEVALVVAHDAVNKTILCALLGLGPGDIWTVKQGNGGITVIDYPEGPAGPAVVAGLNLTGHLGGVIDRTAAGAL